MQEFTASCENGINWQRLQTHGLPGKLPQITDEVLIVKKYAKTPTIFQMEATECGAASLSMIFAYWGKHIPLEQMRIETGVSRDGCNGGNLMRTAKKYGLECHGYRKELKDLLQLPVPSIIHWNFNHFVVFEGIRGKHAYLNDPAVGRRRLTMEELDEGFTGVVLVFKPTPSFQKEKEKRTMASFIAKRSSHVVGVLLKLIYVGLLLVFPGLILPVLSQTFFDDVLTRGYTDWLVRVLVFMGACVLFKFILFYYRSLLLQKLKSAMVLVSGKKFLAHMFRLPISFFDQRYTGDLVTRIEDNGEVDEFLAGDFTETFLNMFIAVFYLILLFLYSWQMTLIGLGQTVICAAVVIASSKTISDTSVKMQMTEGKLYGAVCAGLNITDTLKASGVDSQYSTRILGFQAKNAVLTQKLNRFQQIVSIMPEAVGNLSDVLLLMIGACLVIQGQLTMGMLMAYNALFDAFCTPVNALVGFTRNLQQLKTNISRVEDIEKYQAEKSLCPKAEEIKPYKLSGEVELRKVSFGYSPLKPPLIEDLSFTLNCGGSIAFVGPSGSGKSSIAKVVSGLYSPWEGEVLFDGKPVSQIPKVTMNASVATVSQNITLFSGSIRDNIKMWNSAISDEDMEKAAKDACIHDFIIRQPGGYGYMLCENASNLSGGQRQRLEIARALATNPSVLIMDEATSALDPIVEKTILDNIRARDCTCVIVAHRLSAFRDCDEIIVMKDGKIMERGTHRSLYQSGRFYPELIAGE